MGFRVGDRDDIERAIRLLFRLFALTVGTLLFMMLFDLQFGLKPSLISAMLSGGIAGGIGHGLAEGGIALLGLIWPRRAKRRKSPPPEKEAKPLKRRSLRPLRPLDDE